MDELEFHNWFKKSQPGDQTVYHTGPNLQGCPCARIVYELGNEGVVALTKVRVTKDRTTKDTTKSFKNQFGEHHRVIASLAIFAYVVEKLSSQAQKKLEWL